MKKNLYRRGTALLLAACLLLSCAACGGGTAAATMHLRRTEGTVGVSDGAGKGVEPREDLGLYSGYGVDTSSESYAWIDLDSVKLTKLDQNSEIEIKKEDKLLEIEVLSGSLFFNVTEPLKDNETMEIRTSSMTVGIRGTCGWVTDTTAALLEGTVSVTAVSQSVTVTAGEIAVVTADGKLEVLELCQDDIPAFVREELAEDEALAQAAEQLEETKDPLADYADFLSTRPNILYTELVDFEVDGNPELLVFFTVDSEPGRAVSLVNVNICRKETDGMTLLYEREGFTMYPKGSISLVESSGRPFMHVHNEFPVSPDATTDWYYGSVAQQDGGPEDWGCVDNVDGGITIGEGLIGGMAPHGENGLTVRASPALDVAWAPREELDAARNKYTNVRSLIYITDDAEIIVTP